LRVLRHPPPPPPQNWLCRIIVQLAAGNFEGADQLYEEAITSSFAVSDEQFAADQLLNAYVQMTPLSHHPRSALAALSPSAVSLGCSFTIHIDTSGRCFVTLGHSLV
jgi:hypothetical protein